MRYILLPLLFALPALAIEPSCHNVAAMHVCMPDPINRYNPCEPKYKRSCNQLAESPRVGDTILASNPDMKEWHWWKEAPYNLDMLANEPSCGIGIDSGGKFEVVDAGGSLILEYTAEYTGGTRCDNYTLFEVSRQAWADLVKQEAEIIERFEHKHKKIQRVCEILMNRHKRKDILCNFNIDYRPKIAKDKK